jgi:hypothetical protein
MRGARACAGVGANAKEGVGRVENVMTPDGKS